MLVTECKVRVSLARRNVISAESDLKKIDEEIAEAEKDEHHLETRVRMKMDEKHKLELAGYCLGEPLDLHLSTGPHTC